MLRSGALLAIAGVCAADLNFLAVGDWGRVNIGEKSAAAGMEKVAQQLDAKFVVMLGDNFYSSGIHGSDKSAQFKDVFEDIYNGKTLETLPFYAIAGNHDHYGNVTAEIEYTGDSKRWEFPDYYYNKIFNISGTSGMTFEMVLFDTVVAAGNTDDNENKFDQPPGAASAPSAAAQYKWLFDTMAASTADYLWVAGHYPVYSACSHGPTQELINKLKPELEKHGGHYMCGHDHCQGHITENNVQYVVAGAGMECCYGVDNVGKVPKDSIKFWMGGSQGKGYQPMPGGIAPKSGFASFQIGADSMKVVYHSDGGEVLYTTDPILPRKKQKATLFV